ncbi:unnamed protein product, partial [Rotaria sp. Silwood1]
MGGIRYEITDEASTSWCEIIKDNDPITTSKNIRQTWKNFKSANADWDFGDDLRVRETLATSYPYIWEKVGKQLCDHFGNGMKFVKQNTPPVVNHFIFVLDHSGSMNETSNILTRLMTLTAIANNSNETNLSPWEHLRRAIKGFIDIRIKQTIQGKLVNIEQAEDLVEAYAQIAEILGNEGFYGVDEDFAGPRSYGGHGGFGSYA